MLKFIVVLFIFYLIEKKRGVGGYGCIWRKDVSKVIGGVRGYLSVVIGRGVIGWLLFLSGNLMVKLEFCRLK